MASIDECAVDVRLGTWKQWSELLLPIQQLERHHKVLIDYTRTFRAEEPNELHVVVRARPAEIDRIGQELSGILGYEVTLPKK